MLNDFTESLLCPQIFVILKQLLSRNVLDLLNTVCVNENYPENLCGQRLLRLFFFLSGLSFLNLFNTEFDAEVITFEADGTIFNVPLAFFNISPNLSKESASTVITLIGIPGKG